METPDVTRAQIVSVAGAVLGLAAAFGLHLTGAQQSAIVNTVEIVAPTLVVADALIRHGRAKALAAVGERAGQALDTSSK